MYLHMYLNPTAGAANGTQVSEGTDETPITAGPLNASTNEESAPIKIGLRCESGYKTSGNVVITPVAMNKDKWALALDSGGAPGTFGAWGAALTISTAIIAVNSIFWVKARATSDENPVNDTSVDLHVNATIIPA